MEGVIGSPGRLLVAGSSSSVPALPGRGGWLAAGKRAGGGLLEGTRQRAGLSPFSLLWFWGFFFFLHLYELKEVRFFFQTESLLFFST